jgi:hypothetical protein
MEACEEGFRLGLKNPDFATIEGGFSLFATQFTTMIKLMFKGQLYSAINQGAHHVRHSF